MSVDPENPPPWTPDDEAEQEWMEDHRGPNDELVECDLPTCQCHDAARQRLCLTCGADLVLVAVWAGVSLDPLARYCGPECDPREVKPVSYKGAASCVKGRLRVSSADVIAGLESWGRRDLTRRMTCLGGGTSTQRKGWNPPAIGLQLVKPARDVACPRQQQRNDRTAQPWLAFSGIPQGSSGETASGEYTRRVADPCEGMGCNYPWEDASASPQNSHDDASLSKPKSKAKTARKAGQ